MDNLGHENPVALALKFLIGIIAIFYMSTLLIRSEEGFIKTEEKPINETKNVVIVARNNTVTRRKILKSIVIQPHCHISYNNVILKEIIFDLYLKNEMCTPKDFNNTEKHKIPKVASRTIKRAEPKGNMVVYIAVGLLLTSLGAAFVEVFKAKQQPQTKSKPALTRTCSLADLTVLRHNRKESMRRDSFLDSSDHRGPSKLLDRHTPLLRRCSFPVGPGDLGSGAPPYGAFHGSRLASRKSSIDNEGPFFTEHRHTHVRLLHRH